MTTTPQSPTELQARQRNAGLGLEDQEALVEAVLNCSPTQRAELVVGLAGLMCEWSEEVVRHIQHKNEDEEVCEVEDTDMLVMAALDMKSWRTIFHEVKALSYLQD